MGGRSGGRKKGSKNASTLWRNAQKSLADGSIVVEAADPIEVIENVMRYFYAMGLQGVKAKAPVDEVGKYFKMAVHAAAIAAPFRQPRLSAVKHVDGLSRDGSIDGISPNATPEELRAEIAKRVKLLADKGYIDLDAIDASPSPASNVTGDLGDAGGEDPQG
jgi:hypothetical protein